MPACLSNSTNISKSYKELGVLLNNLFSSYLSTNETLVTKIGEFSSGVNGKKEDFIDYLDDYIEHLTECCLNINTELDKLIFIFENIPCIVPIDRPTTTAEPTTTEEPTTTDELPTTTSEPVTPTTAEPEDVCDEPTVVDEKGSYYPYIVNKFLGAETGRVTLTYESFSIPDRFVVVFDGVTVIDTGYIGLAKFQSRLNTAVAAKGDVAGAIDPITSGSVSFIKDTAFEYATVYVYAPLNNTAFEFTLSCPEDYTTTTEAPTTTSEEPTTTSFECVGCYYYILENISDTEDAEFLVLTCDETPYIISIPAGAPSITMCLQSCDVYPQDEYGTAIRTDNCNPTTTVEPTTTEEVTTTVEPTTTIELTTTSQELTTTGEPTTTVEPTTTSEQLTTTEEPTTTVEPTTTSEQLTTTGEPTTTEEVTTTIEPTTTIELTTTEEPTTTEEVTTTAETTTTIEPQTEYGYLYNWRAVIGDTDGDDVSEEDITSSDSWRVGIESDFVTLMRYLDNDGLGSSNDAGKQMKESGTTYWVSDQGTNTSGFNGRGASRRRAEDGVFTGYQQTCSFWSSAEHNSENGRASGTLSATSDTLVCSYSPYSNRYDLKNEGYNIRLIKVSPTQEELELNDGDSADPYVGNNGITYPTVKIGTQVWLAHDLEETKWRSGDNIPYIDNEDAGDDALWAAATSAAYCLYGERTTTTV